MEIVRARQQRIWKLPAVINFTLGSMGAGYYLLTRFESLLEGGAFQVSGGGDGILAVALILTGFFALLFEAGNPWKSYLTILNVRHSWMSRELLFAMLFMVFVGSDWLAPHGLLQAGAGLMAFLFIVSQAFIVYKSRAVLSWNVWPIPPLLILSGMSSGFGPYLFTRMSEGIGRSMMLLGAGLLLLCLGFVFYYLFVFRSTEAEFQAATRILRSRLSLGVGVVLGLFSPIMLLPVARSLSDPTVVRGLYAVAGAFVILGAWQRIRDIITRAGYFRTIDIKM